MNIRSTYCPSSRLNQFIDLIWIGDGNKLETSSFHYAAMFTEVVFNYDGNFQMDGQNVEHFSSNGNQQIISGLKSRPFYTGTSGSYNNVGLIMKPHGYGLLLDHFGTKTFDNLSEIIHENLVDKELPDYSVVEESLLKLFEKKSIDTDILKFEKLSSIEFIKKGFHKNFANSISTSQKSFIGKFKRLYHLTPNKYLLLKQVNCATRLIQAYPSTSLTEIGLEAGFYDQAHFIRTFKAHHGYSPKQFEATKNYQR